VALLQEAGLTGAAVSLHSADATVSDEMTGAPGTHAKTVRGIEALLEHGIQTGLTCVVERKNVDGLRGQAEFAVDRFVTPFPQNPLFSVIYIPPFPYLADPDFSRRLVPFDEVQGPLVEAVDLLLEHGVEIDPFRFCSWPVCLFKGARKLVGLMQSSVDLSLLVPGQRYGPPCAPCVLKDRCHGVREVYASVFGFRGLSPFLTTDDSV